MRNIFYSKATLSKEEVLSFLERMEALEVDNGGWDYFINVPIKNEQLDVIREQCRNIWENDIYLEQNSDGDYVLSSEGLLKIRELKEQCAKCI